MPLLTPDCSPETALSALLIPRETCMRDMRARRRFQFPNLAATSRRSFRFGLDEIFVVDLVVGILERCVSENTQSNFSDLRQ
jgi:hypothetical protein